MRTLLLSLLATAAALAAPHPIFDGKTFAGWEGDTAGTWRIVDGAITAGSLDVKAPRNEFLATEKSYRDFDLTVKFKLLGSEGFVNGGVQFRSVRIAQPPNEMSGYQADIGGPTYWGCLYDESRRRKMLVEADQAKLASVLKKDDWNEYRIRCEGARVQLWINGVQTVDYTEADPAIAQQDGKIAVQIHGNGKTQVFYKDIAIEELPAR